MKTFESLLRADLKKAEESLRNDYRYEELYWDGHIAPLLALIAELQDNVRGMKDRVVYLDSLISKAFDNGQRIGMAKVAAESRAAALADAAQLMVARGDGHAASQIRALSATPATVVCVPVETFERVLSEGAKAGRVIDAMVAIAERARDDFEHIRDGGTGAWAQQSIARIDAAGAALPDQDLDAALAEIAKVTP